MHAVVYHIARRFLKAQNARHVRSQPQVACFAFDLITLGIHLDGQFEHDELQFLGQQVFPRLPDRAVALDIGANIGNHAVHFARSFDRVLAFEPHPRTFRLLAFNAELAPGVVPLNVGASDRAGSVDVVQDPLNIGATSVLWAGEAGAGSYRLALQRLDDMPEIAALPSIGFVKIDIEGHEPEALEGAAETLRRHRPLIAMEVLPQDVADGTTRSVTVLRRLGYDHFYDMVPGGVMGRLPRPLWKAARTLAAIVTGRRAGYAGRLARVERLERRKYRMLLCASGPLPDLPPGAPAADRRADR